MSGHPNLPDGWQYDSRWRIAAYLLDTLDAVAGRDALVWAYVGPAGINWTGMLAQDWRDWQLPLVLAARSLWDGQPVSLLDLAEGLDELLWHRLLVALAMIREERR